MKQKLLVQYLAFVQAGLFVTRFPLLRLLPRKITDDLHDTAGRYFIAYTPFWGLLLALPCAGLAYGAHLGGLPWPLAAGLMVLLGIVFSGALHEDGLSDCCDGFWGAQTPERRHAIMKDSSVGAYGILGLIFSVCMRWVALALLVPKLACLVFLVLHFLPRGFLGLLWSRLPLWQGKSLTKNSPNVLTGFCGALFGVFLLAVVQLLMKEYGLQPFALSLVVAGGFLSMLAFSWLAVHKLGGINGDCLGAAEQIGQISIVLLLFWVMAV